MNSIDETVTKLKATGVKFRTDVLLSTGDSQILIEDPSGNPIELFEGK